ncbi:MAG: metallophosphoesterase [Kiritimatiellae bacterium]|nr:metallophosphoesterase [Kiritimatiellia bacterium]
MKTEKLSRRGFLRLAGAMGAATFTGGCVMPRFFTGDKSDFDDNLVVFLSDLHVRNSSCYQYRYFASQVAEILRMDPLPRRVIVFGDIAYHCGLKEEYETSAPFFRQMIALGIEVVFGMGNHDRRSAFLETWPEYAARQIFPGRIVSSTDLGPVDLLMLDGLQGTDDRGPQDMGPVPGDFDLPQQEWIADRLSRLSRPTIVASHYPLVDLKVCGKPFRQVLGSAPYVVGYVHGHDHRWKTDWISRGWKSSDIVRTLCLPSTGHWGDIGYATFRLSCKGAVAKFVQKGFFFPGPDNPRTQAWDDIEREHREATCTFSWQ